MCGGGDEPFPAVAASTGVSLTDLAEGLALFSAPLGLGVSLLAGALLLKGMGRRLSLAALGLLLLSAGLLLYAAGPYGLGYTAKRQVEGLAALFGFASFFAIYLRHTYAPTARKWVNLPATLGLGGSLTGLALLVLLSSRLL